MVKQNKPGIQRPPVPLIIGSTVLLVAVIGAAIWYHPTTKVTTKPTDYLPKAEEGTGTIPSATSTAGGAAATPAPIATSSVPQTSTDNSIVIRTPTQGSTVKDGSDIAGTANISTSTLYYRLKGGQSGQLASGQISVTPNQATPYSFKLGFTNNVAAGGDQGELEVYSLDANNAATNIASVAVNIQE